MGERDVLEGVAVDPGTRPAAVDAGTSAIGGSALGTGGRRPWPLRRSARQHVDERLDERRIERAAGLVLQQPDGALAG